MEDLFVSRGVITKLYRPSLEISHCKNLYFHSHI